VLFGSVTLFFGWLQYATFTQAEFLQWVEAGSATEAPLVDVIAANTALRWFFVIVLYGVFIPNTWQRCASLTGVMALTAVLITIATGLASDCSRLHLRTTLLGLAVLLP